MAEFILYLLSKYRTRLNRPRSVDSLFTLLGPDFKHSNCKNAYKTLTILTVSRKGSIYKKKKKCLDLTPFGQTRNFDFSVLRYLHVHSKKVRNGTFQSKFQAVNNALKEKLHK